MKRVHFVVLKNDSVIKTNGSITKLKKNSLISIIGEPHFLNKLKETEIVISFNNKILIYTFDDFRELLFPCDPSRQFSPETHLLSINDNFVNTIELIKDFDRKTLFKFIYIFCLGVNRKYFSSLYFYLMDEKMHYIEYISRYYKEQCSVSDYAERLGVSIKALNNVFHETFQVSAKQWIMAKRLESCQLLIKTTNMKISDIALSCGFSNHAHLTEIYRKTYGCSPRSLRKESLSLM